MSERELEVLLHQDARHLAEMLRSTMGDCTDGLGSFVATEGQLHRLDITRRQNLVKF